MDVAIIGWIIGVIGFLFALLLGIISFFIKKLIGNVESLQQMMVPMITQSELQKQMNISFTEKFSEVWYEITAIQQNYALMQYSLNNLTRITDKIIDHHARNHGETISVVNKI